MKPYKSIDLKSNPIFLRFITGDRLAVVTKDGAFRLLDSNDGFKSQSAFKSGSAQTSRQGRTTIISKTGNTAIYLDKKTGLLHIVDIMNLKVIGKFNKHGDGLTCVTLDNDDLYLATGGEEGGVYLYNAEDGDYVMKLPSHPDYISVMGFSFNGSYFISGGYDGSLVITNISAEISSKRFRAFDRSRITTMLFLPDSILVLGNEIGEIVFIDYLKPKVLKRLMVGSHAVTGLLRGFGGKMLFVSMEEKKLALVNLENYEILSKDLFELRSDISSMATMLSANILVLGMSSGQIDIYQIHNAQELKEMIDSGDYAKAYQLVEENSLLLASEQYLRLEEIWLKCFDKAIKLLCKKENELAKALLEPFMCIGVKASRIKQLFSEFQDHDKLEQSIAVKNYANAYSMVQKSRYLKDSVTFLALERKWKESYKKAEELVLVRGKFDQAKALLDHFNRVPAKAPAVHNLLRNPQIIQEAITALKNRDFRTYFEIFRANRFLKETPRHQSIIDYGSHLLEAIRHQIENHNYEEALGNIEQIVHFPHLKEEITELHFFANNAQEFLKAYDEGDKVKCYRMMDKQSFLSEFKEGLALEKEWREKIREGERLSAKQDINGIVELFRPYFHIPSRTSKIGSLLRRAYHRQLLQACEDKVDFGALERAIKHYLTMFGYDDHIEDVIIHIQKSYHNTFLIGESEKERQVNWLFVTKGNLPSNILE